MEFSTVEFHRQPARRWKDVCTATLEHEKARVNKKRRRKRRRRSERRKKRKKGKRLFMTALAVGSRQIKLSAVTHESKPIERAGRIQ